MSCLYISSYLLHTPPRHITACCVGAQFGDLQWYWAPMSSRRSVLPFQGLHLTPTQSVQYLIPYCEAIFSLWNCRGYKWYTCRRCSLQKIRDPSRHRDSLTMASVASESPIVSSQSGLSPVDTVSVKRGLFPWCHISARSASDALIMATCPHFLLAKYTWVGSRKV